MSKLMDQARSTRFRGDRQNRATDKALMARAVLRVIPRGPWDREMPRIDARGGDHLPCYTPSGADERWQCLRIFLHRRSSAYVYPLDSLKTDTGAGWRGRRTRLGVPPACGGVVDCLGGHANQIPYRHPGATPCLRRRGHRYRWVDDGVCGPVELGQGGGDDDGDGMTAVRPELAGCEGCL
jgi:hypothetical protein